MRKQTKTKIASTNGATKISGQGWRKTRQSIGVLGSSLMVVTGTIIASLLLDSNPVLAEASASGSASIDGTKIDLSTGGEATASSVSITMGDTTKNGQLNASSTDPNKSAGLVKRTASVEIGATDGYTVTLSGNPNLTGANGNNKIPTITSNTTLAQMDNQWGWYTTEGDVDCSALQTMKQMKSTGDQIAAGTLDAKTTKQFTMCFGAKVNGSQAADTYSNTVTLSVVAQPKVVQTFGGITTMQAMTSDVCKAASVNDTAYLRDTRDNKSYWVTKLADGNCWMSQNLAYDLSGIKTITTLGATSDSGASSDDNYGSYSWSAGAYVISDPVKAQACANNSVGLSGCSEFTSVGGRTPAVDPNFYRLEMYTGTDGSTCTKSANTTASTATSGPCAQYDAHYFIGNYYQWNAATAGTGGSITNANASGSICPKGWKLPNSAIDANTITKGTYAYLLQQYGLVTAYNTGTITGTSGVNGNTYNIALSPLFLVRGGDIYLGNATTPFQDAGVRGYYWSSRASSNTTIAYYLLFSTNVRPSSSASNRYYGVPLRCLIPTP